MPLIDTHCHLDADEFAADRGAMLQRASAAGIRAMVLPAVAPANFQVVRDLAHKTPACGYALGIHPLFVCGLDDTAIGRLREALTENQSDPRLLAVGEIGLDFFVSGQDHARQEWFYREQLALAVEFGLPVLLHVRRSADRLLKYLRPLGPIGGIAHAFNGSRQQADQFLALGFALGFGGAMTWSRARNIRRLASDLPDTAIVLETDAPDIPPEWLAKQRNEPAELPRIALCLAQLRGDASEVVIAQTARNACRVLPRLQSLLIRP